MWERGIRCAMRSYGDKVLQALNSVVVGAVGRSIFDISRDIVGRRIESVEISERFVTLRLSNGSRLSFDSLAFSVSDSIGTGGLNGKTKTVGDGSYPV